jgi:uroporphyrin-3 C-methyltransferase
MSDDARASIESAAPDSAPPNAAAVLVFRMFLGALTAVALVALLVAIMLWLKVGAMQEQLARQSADALAQSLEARTFALHADEIVRDAAGRLALVETRVAEVALQRAQLEEIMQSLSRSRDESLAVDVEAALRFALQQAQVTGNVQPLLAALKAGEQRVARAAQPRLAPVQRAMQNDIDRLRASAGAGMVEALLQIDELIRRVDDLPTVNAVAVRADGDVEIEPVPADASWWERILPRVRAEARALLRVSRIEYPDAALLTPQQTFFLRENFKLKLLSARLSVLSRQVDAARGQLAEVSASLNHYFDPASRRVQAAATLLQQIQAWVKNTEPVHIDETLAALATAAAGR